MKIKDNFVLRNVAGVNVVLPLGKEAIDFNGMITLNDSGVFLWKKLNNDVSIDELISAVLQEYEIDEETASNDIDEFIEKLKSANILE